jgi:hypothetical protein
VEHVNGNRYAPVPGKIPGTELNLGGVIFIAAPFNLDGVQEAMTLLESLKDAKSVQDNLKGTAQVLLISLRRNYPDLTIDELAPLIDLGNWQKALMAVCGASGLEFQSGERVPVSQ